MLELKNLTKVYGQAESCHLAVNNIDLDVDKGEFVVLIGPSGCGKTTTLKMVNHLIEPTSGEILINGSSTTELNAVELRRNIGYVIQNIGLFPHFTIVDNVEIVPKLKQMDPKKRRQRTLGLMEMVGLEPDVYADRYPAELSGGQQQRVGVLRALAAEPDLILMDEPFGALDPITRDQLQTEMKQLQQKLNKTIIFVTHDIDEAIEMADTIVLMKDGQIVQAASPREILTNPANSYVREFIGEERLAPEPDITPVADVMVMQPLTVSMDTTPKAVLRQMQKHRADFAVVVDDAKRFVGLISANQIMRNRGKNKTLTKMLQTEDNTVRSHTTIRDATAALANEVQVLCVVDRKRRPVGLVSRTTYCVILKLI